MNLRRFHFYHMVTPSGLYETFDEGVKELNAFVNVLGRECEKSLKRKYGAFSCVMFAGISRRDPKLGEIYFERSGAPVFVPHEETKCEDDSFTHPHLHIILLGYPGHEITEIIKDYFKKKHYDYFERTGNSPISRYQRDNALENTVNYALRQSEKFRTFHFNANGFEEGFVDTLCSMVENYYLSHGRLTPVFQKLYESLYDERTTKEENSDTLFTFSEEPTHPITPATASEDNVSETSFQPVCNNITTITSNTSNNYHHRYTIANLLNYLWRYITHSKASTSNKLIVAGNSS